MPKYSDDYYKNILARLLRLSLTNTEPAKELIEQMFDDEDFKEQARNLGDAYMKSKYRKSTLISKTIDVRALSSLVKICKKRKLGIIPLDFNGEEDHVYENGDKINVLILSLQEEEFDEAALEACAVSGVADEIIRKYADIFAKPLNDENAMMEIKNVDPSVYESMQKQMQKLPYFLRFTMFPDTKENGKVDVGFFTKTKEVNISKGKKVEKNGPYLIPKIASVLLACSLLDDPEHDEAYKEDMKQNKELLNAILGMYYEYEDDAFYLVPAIIKGDGMLSVFMDQNEIYDINSSECPEYVDFQKFVSDKTSGLNHTVVPMTEAEFHKYKNEVVINPNSLSFYEKHGAPAYINPDVMRNSQISEQLIDVLNRKREQVLLMSDDFNGRNLGNLENYIAGSVHEIIMREDEDFSDWLEQEEIRDGKESWLLSKLEDSYQLSYAYDGHDRVSELIEAERQELGISKAIEEHEEER